MFVKLHQIGSFYYSLYIIIYIYIYIYFAEFSALIKFWRSPGNIIEMCIVTLCILSKRLIRYGGGKHLEKGRI